MSLGSRIASTGLNQAGAEAACACSGRRNHVVTASRRTDAYRVNAGTGRCSADLLRACSYKQGAVQASTEPQVLNYLSSYKYNTTYSLQQHVDELSTQLGLSARSVEAMANKQPALLSLSVTEVKSQFDGVQRSLKLAAPQARELVSYHPHLLLMTQGALDRTLQLWEAHLGVPKATLVMLVSKQPFILQASLESLEAKVDALGLALNADRQQVLLLAASMPELLLHSPDRVTDNLKQLCVILDLPLSDVLNVAMQYPPLLIRSSELTSHYLHLIANFMDVPVPQAVALVVKRPEVLGVSWTTLKDTFDKVCAYFGDSSRERVVDLVVSNPSILPLLQDNALHQHSSM